MGHPEWIDFPREGNGWTYHYARRQWSLLDDENLKFKDLGYFDQSLINLFKNTIILKNKINNPQIDNKNKILSFERGDFIFCFESTILISQGSRPILAPHFPQPISTK